MKVKAKVKGTKNPKVEYYKIPNRDFGFPTGTLNRKLYIPLLSIGKKLGGENEKNDNK